MKAIILAAGTASRLRPLTADTPKCLLKVGERTLLQRSLDALIAAGIREFVIVTGYLHEKIETFVKQTYGESIDVCFIHNNVYESTNNIYSLWLARREAEGEEILLLDSDLLYDPEIVLRVLASEHDNVLTLIRHDLGDEEMKVVTAPTIPSTGRENRPTTTFTQCSPPLEESGEASDLTIVEISKTCSPALATGESLGIERMGKAYTRALYEELDRMMNAEHLENKFYELAFQRLISKGHTFSVLDVTDLFSCELDTVEDFENAKQLIPARLF